jgi:hypothetical protein
MSRRGADEVSGSPELQARLLGPAGPAQMNAASRDEPIMRLHNRGYTPAQIGKASGGGPVHYRGCRSATKASGTDGHNGPLWPHKIKTSTECRLGGEPSKA